MGKGMQLSLEEKTKIMCWSEIGMTNTEIAERLGRSVVTIRLHRRLLKDLPPNAPSPPPRPRSGRPRISSPRRDARLKKYVELNPAKTAKELKKEVFGWDDKSVRFIQKKLQKELGLPSRCAAKKPLLTAKIIKKRLAGAPEDL